METRARVGRRKRCTLLRERLPRRFCLEGSMPLWKARSVFAAESATRGPKASKYKHNNVRSWRRRHAVLGQRRVQGPVLEGPEVRREVGKPRVGRGVGGRAARLVAEQQVGRGHDLL